MTIQDAASRHHYSQSGPHGIRSTVSLREGTWIIWTRWDGARYVEERHLGWEWKVYHLPYLVGHQRSVLESVRTLVAIGMRLSGVG